MVLLLVHFKNSVTTHLGILSKQSNSKNSKTSKTPFSTVFHRTFRKKPGEHVWYVGHGCTVVLTPGMVGTVVGGTWVMVVMVWWW